MIKGSCDFSVPTSVPKGGHAIRIGLWIPAEKEVLEISSSNCLLD